MTYEVERIYLNDADGNPAQITDELHLVDAPTARDAAVSFVAADGARLLGTVCDAPGDQCTATAWRNGRAYVITVWPLGHRPQPPSLAGLWSN